MATGQANEIEELDEWVCHDLWLALVRHCRLLGDMSVRDFVTEEKQILADWYGWVNQFHNGIHVRTLPSKEDCRTITVLKHMLAEEYGQLFSSRDLLSALNPLIVYHDGCVDPITGQMLSAEELEHATTKLAQQLGIYFGNTPEEEEEQKKDVRRNTRKRGKKEEDPAWTPFSKQG